MTAGYCYADCGQPIVGGERTEYILRLDEHCHEQCYTQDLRDLDDEYARDFIEPRGPQ